MGKQKQTAARLRERGEGGGRASAVLTVYLTYDVNVSAAVIVWQNWSTTHTHKHTLRRMYAFHYTTTNTCAAAEREQCTRRQQRRRRRRNRCPLLITFIFNTLTGSGQRQADVASLQTFRSCCCCWFYACVGILTFNVRQQLQMLAAMSASSLVIQSAAAAHAGGGSTLKA